MKIAICPLCTERINRGDRITVLSYPLKSTNDEADYSIMGSFIDNEKVVHYNCFSREASDLEYKLSGNLDKFEYTKESPRKIRNDKSEKIQQYYTTLPKGFHSLLESIGENISMKEVNDFILSNKDSRDNESLLALWLENRKSTHLSH